MYQRCLNEEDGLPAWAGSTGGDIRRKLLISEFWSMRQNKTQSVVMCDAPWAAWVTWWVINDALTCFILLPSDWKLVFSDFGWNWFRLLLHHSLLAKASVSLDKNVELFPVSVFNKYSKWLLGSDCRRKFGDSRTWETNNRKFGLSCGNRCKSEIWIWSSEEECQTIWMWIHPHRENKG